MEMERETKESLNIEQIQQIIRTGIRFADRQDRRL